MQKKNRGKFIVFEGLDGSGTSTQAKRLGQYLEHEKHWAVINTSEPTQGPMGLLLRLILSNRLTLDTTKSLEMRQLSNSAMALLFAADRLDHLQQIILPKLEDGVFVICERYYLSSFAYQMSQDKKNLDWLRTINSRALSPDLMIFLRTPLEVCDQRRQKRWQKEIFEHNDILRQVDENYLYAIEQLKAEIPIEIIDGSNSEDSVLQQTLVVMQQHFPDLFSE